MDFLILRYILIFSLYLQQPFSYIYIYIYIIKITIIMSHYQHGYPWPFLATFLNRPLLPAGPQEYIPYRHRATVCRFLQVVLPLPQEYVTYEFVPTSPVVTLMSGSSNLIVVVIGGKWPYSCCFVGCCPQDFFNIDNKDTTIKILTFFKPGEIPRMCWRRVNRGRLKLYHKGAPISVLTFFLIALYLQKKCAMRVQLRKQ